MRAHTFAVGPKVGRTGSVLYKPTLFGGLSQSSLPLSCRGNKRRLAPLLRRASQSRFTRRLVALLVVSVTVSSSHAQRALTDIPNPDPEYQLSKLNPADGFEISLFASDPLIDKPLAMSFDAKGRLWVACTTTYPHIKPGELPSDRVYRIEDTDGDGIADKRTVFVDNLLMPTAILATPEGVYVGNSTDLMFYEDKDDDGVADNEQVLLSGFGTEDTHHIVHTLRAGPAGRIYFNQSIYIHSYLETPHGIRELKAGGVWRLRPETLELDVYNNGLVNSWGHQFDYWGQSFQSDGAGFEGISYSFPGAAFRTSVGVDRFLPGLNPGQPKFSGLEIVDTSHFPEEWQGRVIVCDFRGNRISVFKPVDSQSGFLSQQQEDLLTSTHGAFRPIDLQFGPDGALYVADWYNPIIQHGEVDFRDERRDRNRGRIWKITARGKPLVERPKLVGASVAELLELLKSTEAWTRTQARLQLKHHGAKAVLPALRNWVRNLDATSSEYEHHLLEALWVTQSLRQPDLEWVESLLKSDDFRARAAAMRVVEERPDQNPRALEFFEQGVNDEHPRVQLEALHGLRALGGARSAKLAMKVFSDSMDETLEFGLWRTMNALGDEWLPEVKKNPLYLGENPRKLIYANRSLSTSEALSPLVKLWKSGGLNESEELEALVLMGELGDAKILSEVFKASVQRDRKGLDGVSEILEALEAAASQRKVIPDVSIADIEALIESERLESVVRMARLAGSWNAVAAVPLLEKLAANTEASVEEGNAAVEGLARMRSKESNEALNRLGSDRYPVAVRIRAIAGFARTEPSAAAPLVAEALSFAGPGDDALPLLRPYLTRAKLANDLSESLQGKTIDGEVAMEALRLFGSAPIDASKLKKAVEDAAGIEPLDQQLDAEEMAAFIEYTNIHGDAKRGEAVYRRDELLCLTCHAIGGSGGSLGPDLTSLGASAPMDYIVDSLLQPQKKIKEGYHVVSVTRKDGSALAGTLAKEDGQSITLRDTSDREIVISKSDIQSQMISPVSLMPPGLTASLRKDELADLVAFLSKLGKEGDFKVSSDRVVRTFQYLDDQDGDKGFADILRHKPLGYVTSDDPRFNWLPTYSKVDGTLPLDKIPALRLHRKYYHYLRFRIDVKTPGEIGLELSGASESYLWLEEREIQSSDKAFAFAAERGLHTITMGVPEDASGIRIEIVDIPNSRAQAQIVNGK